MKNSELRIIGGKFKTRKIEINTKNVELRPTLDRVRETVFNWLAPFILEANCLDLFAGTGIFSFEALSRGAKHVTTLEIEPLTYKNIIANKKKLQLDDQQLQIFNQDVLFFLNNCTKLEKMKIPAASSRVSSLHSLNLAPQSGGEFNLNRLNSTNNFQHTNFNLVFLDPPYSKPDLLLLTLNKLVNNNLLAKNSKVYFECYKDHCILEQINFPKQLKLNKSSKAGKVNFYLLDYLPN